MHKFFKGLARAFRCQTQTSSPSASSTRSTSTAAAQQDGVDDNSTGGCSGGPPGALGWNVEYAYFTNTLHFLRAWRVDQDGRTGGGCIVENVGARPPANGDRSQCAWLSLPPARMRRIESIRDLAVGELRAYISTAADASCMDVCTSTMSSARRWFFTAARQWLTDQPRFAASVGHCILPSSPLSTASSSHVTASAAPPARRLIRSSKVPQSDYKQPRSGKDSYASVRSAVGAAALPSSVAADEPTRDTLLPTSAADGRLRAVALPAESSAAADAQDGAVRDAIDDKTVLKGRVKAENLLDASVRQLLELIEMGQGGNTSNSRRRHPFSKENPLAAWPEGEQERARATSPFQQGLPGFPIGSEAQLCLSASAAASINPAASFNLGLCYEHGWGVPMNKSQAAELYRRASELGHMASCYNLAQLYLSGAVAAGGRPAPGEARRLMERAAAGNLVEAQTWLGAMSFEEGNYGAAFKMFEKAAKQNCALAQYYLGVCYENGFGVNASMEAAAAQYKEAAARGIADAQYNLGVFYQGGLGGLPRDLALARDMFAQASQSSQAPVGNKQSVLQQRSHFTSSTSKLVVQDREHGVTGHAQTSSSIVGKSASLPSFACRLSEPSMTDDWSAIRGRCSGPAAAALQNRGDQGHGTVDLGGRDSSSDSSGFGSPIIQPATPPTDDSAIGRSSGEPLFYIGDESDLSNSDDGTSESDEPTEWSDDSGHLSPVGCELLPTDAFGESLSNPYFGSSLMG